MGTHHAGAPAPPIGQREIFRRTSLTDRNLSSVSQAGLVNKSERWHGVGTVAAVFAAAGMSLGHIATLAAIYPAVWGMGQLVTGALSDRIGRKRLIGRGNWIQAGGIAVTSAVQSFAGFAIGGMLLGLGTAMVYLTLLAAVGDVAHPSWRASAVGVYRIVA